MHPLGRAGQSRIDGADWRAWLARRVGCPDLATHPPAHVAALALGVPPVDAWFATPVALTAALDHVQMPGSGWLTLEPGEAEEFSTQFARVFAGSGLSLWPAGAEGFVLSGLVAGDVRASDPARVLGGDIGPWLATGEGATALRRLGTEIEMWLHEHPVNRARARRGAMPAATLWLWGGGEAACAASPHAQRHGNARRAAPPRGYGSDSWLRGLWRACGHTLEGEAASLAEVALAADADTIVVARNGVDEGVVERWLGPALAHLAARRVRAVQFVIDERLFGFSRFDLVKPWRRAVSWEASA